MSISDTEAKALYKKLKTNINKIYSEELHCKMVIKVMSDTNRATMASFCVEAGISDGTFYKWLNKYEVFKECYRYGCMISQNNWDQMGSSGMHDDMFNIEIWKVQGASRYGVGKTNRVRVHIDAETTPFDQYKQLMSQASNGDFTAGELKQLMESINIGLRAYEVVELQKDIDVMKDNLKKMENNVGHDSRAIASPTKAD